MNRTKFNVAKDKAPRTHNGIVFDSVMEMKYYRDVVLPSVERGEIKYYELQKTYMLQPGFMREGKKVKPITYVADFYIEYADGRVEVIDTKGCPDAAAKLKRKLMWYVYPDLVYRWVVYSKMDGGWCDFEDVDAARKQRRNQRRQNMIVEEH